MMQSLEEEKVIEVFEHYYSKIPDLIMKLGMDMYGTEGRSDLAKSFMIAHFFGENTKALRDY